MKWLCCVESVGSVGVALAWGCVDSVGAHQVGRLVRAHAGSVGHAPLAQSIEQLAGLGDGPRVMNSMCGFFSNKINHNKIYCFYKKIF
jgi:hypothetical protein